MADWGPQLTQNPLNTVPLLTRSFNPASQDIVALASGRAYRTSFGGDVLMNIYLDGSYKGQNASQWSDNDENEAAEVQAPLYSHAFFATPPSGIRTVSLNAMEFPYGFENPLRYRFGARTSLVVLSGGMTIKGAAPALQAPGCLSNDYIPIGPSIHCPDLRPLNTAYKIAERMIDFGQTARPVLLSAKTREQGGEGRSTNPACPCGNCCINEFGNVSLWITIDGVQKGSFGVQYLQSPAMCSQRTLTASYLATNLTGNHNVAVYAKADGSMCDINIQREIPLVWFD